MNNQTQERVSMVCRMVRGWEARRGPANGHTALLSRHMKTCDACAVFFSEDAGFETLLRADARGMHAEPRTGFEARILRAVRENAGVDDVSVHVPERGRARTFSPMWSLAGVAAGVALAVIVSLRWPDAPVKPEVATHTPATSTSEGVEAGAAALPGWLQSLNPREKAVELVENNPLRQEMDSLSTDARTVIGFLALNFLPTTATEEPVAQPGGAGQG